MMLFPEVQKRVQKELDTIIGSERLPSIDDFESLPYMRQTIKEALRCMYPSIQHSFQSILASLTASTF